MSIGLVLVAVVLFGLSGVPGLSLSRRSVGGGQRLAAVLMMLGAVVGLIGALMSLAQPSTPEFSAPWGLPLGRFSLAIDALSAFFLLPLFAAFGLLPIYGLSYWKHDDHPDNAHRLRLFFGLLGASMSVILIARDGALFLFAWEVMAISAFFLITTEDEKPSIRQAGFVYFVAAHIGTLCLFAALALWNRATGSLAFAPPANLVAPPFATAIFILALIGFGLKAGIMPLHVWLPGAHAGAPSHVSAVLSGVMLKMGIYGLVRVTGLLPAPPVWWGGLLLALGALSGIVGIVFAIAQTDIKRLLAYSSIENIGIIVMGLGLALLGRATGRSGFVVLGLGAALLHVWNHSLFKPLLFLGAGSIIHSAHARGTDQLGGLGARMPLTASLFLVGAASICALPPLNGFVSEWLLYLGLFRAVAPGTGAAGAAVAVPALAGIGALAAACFVKLYGTVFLGQARTRAAENAHESPPSMLWPMFILAAGCVAIGLFPSVATPMLDRATACWIGSSMRGPASSLASLAPMSWITVTGFLLLVPVILGTLLLARRMAMPREARPGTWDCGHARPTARMQYTGTSFSQMIVAVFRFALRPRDESVDPTGLFPGPSRFGTHVCDTVLDRAVLPAGRAIERALARLWLLQQGWIQAYVLYILVVVVALLWWTWGIR